MSQVVKAESNNLFLILIIIISIITFFYIYPNILKENIEEKFEIDNRFTLPIFIDNDNKIETKKNNSLVKLDQNICSKQCCKFVQWPVSFNTRNPLVKDEILDKFIPSNFACNGGANGGCVCLTKNDYNYLANHGQS